jgi:hypothetical protein
MKILKEGPGFCPRGDNHKNAKIGGSYKNLKNHLARRTYVYMKAF